MKSENRDRTAQVSPRVLDAQAERREAPEGRRGHSFEFHIKGLHRVIRVHEFGKRGIRRGVSSSSMAVIRATPRTLAESGVAAERSTTTLRSAIGVDRAAKLPGICSG
jgi:hypothetical protein